MPQPRQPFLHDLVCTLAAPTQAWSGYDGQIGSAGQRGRDPGCAACGRTRVGGGRAARRRAAARTHRHAGRTRRQPVRLSLAVRGGPAGQPGHGGTDRSDPAGRAGPGLRDHHRHLGRPRTRNRRSGGPAGGRPGSDADPALRRAGGGCPLRRSTAGLGRRRAHRPGVQRRAPHRDVRGSTQSRARLVVHARSGWGPHRVLDDRDRRHRRCGDGRGRRRTRGARPCGRAGPPTRCLAQPGRRGPQRASDDHPAAAGGGVLRRRRALVPHALRARQPVGGPDGAAAGSGAGDRDPSRPRAAGRDHDRCGQRAAARQDRARVAAGDLDARRDVAATAVLRHHRRHPALGLPAVRPVAAWRPR